MKAAAVLLTTVALLALMPFALAQDAPPVDKLVPPAGQAADPKDIVVLKKLIREQKKEIDRLTGELEEAREALEKLRKEMVSDRERREKLAATMAPRPRAAAPAEPETPLTGRITDVRQEKKMALINLGEDHGLRTGDIFEVSRAGKKIGRIKIQVVVDRKWSNALIVESDTQLIPDDVVTKAPVPGAATSPPDTRPQPVAQEEPPRTGTERINRRLTKLEALYADFAEQLKRLEVRIEEVARIATQKSITEGGPPAGPETAAAGPETGAAGPEVERPSSFETTVFAVDKSYVYLPAGTKHGLRAGDTFLIKRGDREIATIKITRLKDDFCETKILTKKSEIRKRDKAILQ